MTFGFSAVLAGFHWYTTLLSRATWKCDVCIRKECCTPCRGVTWQRVSLVHECTRHHLLSADRVPICLVATLVSLATAASSLYYYSTQGACWLCSGSSMTANSSNTTVYDGVTILSLCGLVGVLVGFEATGFLSATGVGHMIAVASSTLIYSTRLCTLVSSSLPGTSCRRVDRLEATSFLGFFDRGHQRPIFNCALPDLLLPTLPNRFHVEFTIT